MGCSRVVSWSFGLALLLVPNTGCFLITQSYYEARGAVGAVDVVGSGGRGLATRFKSVRFEPATTTLDEKLCPPKVLENFDTAIKDYHKELGEKYPGGTPELRIVPDVQYFQKKTVLGSAICIMRVKLWDGANPAGDLLVHSASKAFRAGDERALARACARSLLRQLGADVPEKEKEEGEKKEKENKGVD